ncbi:SUMF1/EgtB/PvdO family nonheme iron enzyme [Chloroflexota bacterium]
MLKRTVYILVIVTFLLPALVIVSTSKAQDGPDEIIIEHHNLFPEGIAYDEKGERFLLSSNIGAVYEVADDGTATAFIEDANFMSPAGLEIDRVNNRLLVANGDVSAFFPMPSPDGPRQANLGSYDLTTGERIFMADLSSFQTISNSDGMSGTLPNDVAVDTEGNAYVTSTISPVIYRVGIDGEASIFVEDESLAWLNGIVAHPDGYLLIGSAENLLFKIPLDEPELIPIELGDGINFDITDGMILLPDGNLVMVTFPSSRIYQLHSNDDWASATLVAESTGHWQGWATTIAYRNGDVYAIYSHLNDEMEGRERDVFEIVPIEFSKEVEETATQGEIEFTTANADWTPTIEEFDGVEMVLVSAGCFVMGNDTDSFGGRDNGGEQCFDEPFWIDRFEVTNAQFSDFGGISEQEGYWTAPDRPRESIMWTEARDFCELRGARLPTEAEWEYAARGPDGLAFPWGNEFVAENVVFGANADSQTANVGSKPDGASWVGALDLSGNVWEFTSTINMDYPYDAGDGREDNSDNLSSRILRGASWADTFDASLRVAGRYFATTMDWNDHNGFRCARNQ